MHGAIAAQDHRAGIEDVQAIGIETLRVVEGRAHTGASGADAETDTAGARPVGRLPDAGVNAAGAVKRAVDIDKGELDHGVVRLTPPTARAKREFAL